MRQLLRLARHAARSGSCSAPCLAAGLASALMLGFLPEVERAKLMALFKGHGIDLALAAGEEGSGEAGPVPIVVTGATLRIGETEAPICPAPQPGLVPEPLFVDIPRHTVLLESMLQSYTLGEHLLLIGNQGVGKNKLCDRLLQLLQREREYIQLHRDTTVQSLTLAPSLEEGHVVWHDSPLVRAMLHGRVLMVDEFDKAPLAIPFPIQTQAFCS